MTQDEINHVRAEVGLLRRQLDAIPAGARMTRRSTSDRIRGLEALLQERAPVPAPTRVRLTFRGRPVVGTHGISAAFGSGAIERFANAVALLAAGQRRQLGARGPIPDRGSNELLIVGSVAGSFGFELEENQLLGLQPESDLAEPTPIAVAIGQAQALLAGASGTDDDLAEAASGVDPRARGAVQEFLSLLARQGAVCVVEASGRSVRFTDVAEVERAAARLTEGNVRQIGEELTGSFQGVLPMRRTFEFKVTGHDEVIAGKVGPAVLDPHQLNDHLREETTIRVTTTQVGAGQPRYILEDVPVFGSQTVVAPRG